MRTDFQLLAVLKAGMLDELVVHEKEWTKELSVLLVSVRVVPEEKQLIFYLLEKFAHF